MALAFYGKSQFAELPKDIADFREATYTISWLFWRQNRAFHRSLDPAHR
jgi:hypothetical protein